MLQFGAARWAAGAPHARDPATRIGMRRHAAILATSIGVVLAGVASAAGNVIEYIYDAAGNVVQVRRQPTSGLLITAVEPGSGAVGAAVTIFGAGFSGVPANNSVQFNGVSATVTASDAGSLAVTVPTGAATGPVSVTVGSLTAFGPQNFVVTIPGAPTVTSFSPMAAPANDVVTVTGAAFEPSGSVNARLNTTSVSASVASATSLTFSIPQLTGSGRISVTNPSGTGQSAQDLIVLPTGYTASDLATTLHLTTGGTGSTFQIGSPGKYGVILFDGSQDIFYTLQFGQIAFSPSTAAVNYKVYGPDNALVAQGNLGYGYRPTVHLPRLPASGTYSVFVSPGVATLTSVVSVAADPVLTIDGPPASIALGTASQTARVVFGAGANQNVGVGVTGFTLSGPTTSGSAFKIYKPDGSQLSASYAPNCTQASSSNPQGNSDGEFTTAVEGTYTMIAETLLGYSASFGIQLNSEVIGALQPDAAQEIALTRVGQDARFTFVAAEGDNLAVDFSGVTPLPQAQNFFVTIYRPNGTAQTSGYASSPSFGILLQAGTIASAGTYSITIDPTFGAYGTGRLTLKRGSLLATTDAPAAFATSVTGETQRFRFEATAGQNLSVGISGLAYVGSSSGSSVLTVYKPDGSALAYNNCSPTTYGGRCKLTLTNLPVNGTYSIGIAPPAGVKLTGTIAVSADLTGSLVEGAPASLLVTRPGQNVRYTFAGTAGQSTAIELAALTTNPAGPYVYVYVVKPDGTNLASSWASSNGVFVNLPSLPITGTYTVLVDATYGVEFSGQLSLKPGLTIEVDGSVQPLQTSIAGEVIRFTFSGTAGSRLDLGLDGLTYGSASSSYTSLAVYRPGGSSLASVYCYTSTAGGGCEAPMPANLPDSGNYSVVLAPPAGKTISGGTLALSTPITGTFVVNAPEQTVAIARPGQTARYTFSGTTSQLLRLNWTGASVSIPGATIVSVSILKPDGATLTSASFGTGATGGVDIAALPATGTYTVVLNPANAATVTAPMALVTR